MTRPVGSSVSTITPRRWSLPDGDRLVIAVAVVVLVALVVPPLAFLVVGSLRTAGPGAPGAQFTIANWLDVVSPEGLNATRNSLVLGLSTSAAAVLVGLVIAWLVVRSDMPFRRSLGSLVIIPLLFSPLLTSLAWVGLAGPNAGLLNIGLQRTFGSVAPSLNIYSFGGMLLVLALHYAPYAYLAMRSALVNIDSDLEDAAHLLGARLFKTLTTITLPLVLPAITAAGILVMILAAEEFTVPTILGSGFGFITLPYLVYSSLSDFPGAPARASAFALVLALIMLAGLFAYLRALRASGRYVTVSGKGSRAGLTRLPGPVKWLAAGFLLAYLVLAVLLPYSTLLLGSLSTYFATSAFDPALLTFVHYQETFRSSRFASALGNTVVVIAVGATITVGFAALLSWISVRSRSRWRRVVDYLATLPVMISGIAIGVGMLWAYTSLRVGLYGTVGILIVAFVTRYVGHGVRITSPSILQLNPELEEAAYTLGSSRVRTFATITLPMLRTALGAAWVVVAIFIALEVSSSVFLYTGRSMTLSIYVWLTMYSGSISSAFAVGAILATFTFTVVAVAQARLRILDKF